MYFRVCHGTPTNKNLEITNCLRENQKSLAVFLGKEYNGISPSLYDRKVRRSSSLLIAMASLTKQ